MFCLIKRENHPDRGIEEVFGPFDTRKAADAEAVRQQAEDAKWFKHHRPYSYDAWSMELPS